MRGLWEVMNHLRGSGRALAWHDIGDGGLLVTLLEMAFAGRTGLRLTPLPVAKWFTEEPGGVVQVSEAEVEAVLELARAHGVPAKVVGAPSLDDTLSIGDFQRSIGSLHRQWADTSYRMQSLRDDPGCAQEAFDQLLDRQDPGLSPLLHFDPADDITAPFIGKRPKVAILREQGVNGQIEMAAAFHAAGFEAVDVHMSDLVNGLDDLSAYAGLAACGGFSYGDVLGAGGGWAKGVLFNPRVRDAFAAFFARETFSLGVCNGCQMMSQLKELIPGASMWPRFVRNRSEQFEARVCTVELLDSPSVLFDGMAGSRLPVAVAHGEGRVLGENPGVIAGRYVDNHGQPTMTYPLNPNGSPGGVTALTTTDGRATILMPHPERVFRTITNSWAPAAWPDDGPWLRMFRNARVFAG